MMRKGEAILTASTMWHMVSYLEIKYYMHMMHMLILLLYIYHIHVLGLGMLGERRGNVKT